MPKLHRKGDGQPLRDAMKAAGLSITGLADATRKVDPKGKGVSSSTVGRIAGRGKTSRDPCDWRTAWVIAEALHERTPAPLQDLFAMPSHLTVTVERSRSDAEEE
ncbi:XRE family transcriptional regulator [Streptomyces sp. NPDC058266]|uniref:XRE family transcriptional regulator n=1 Tax=Streptomyces sp. NPDC058266 TaxID=3346412 RepID=UPI0036EBAD26